MHFRHWGGGDNDSIPIYHHDMKYQIVLYAHKRKSDNITQQQSLPQTFTLCKVKKMKIKNDKR